MAWGAMHNVANVFFGEPQAPKLPWNHPFCDWRRYVKLYYLPDCRRYHRSSLFRLETALGLRVLWYGREV